VVEMVAEMLAKSSTWVSECSDCGERAPR